MSQIKLIPEMPNEIINAIDNQKLVIFTGAGLSALFKFPLWKDFANTLVEECVKHKAMSLSEKDYLKNSQFSSMQIITISYNKLCKKIPSKDAQKIFLSHLKIDEDKQPICIIDEVSKYLSNYYCPIITTNADLSLDNTKYFKYYNNIENFLYWDETTQLTKIIHLHGSINDFDSLIFTSEQYANAYRVESLFGQKLGKLFSDKSKTILFIGCSLSEFELLRYFIKIRNEDVSNLFLLNGYLNSESLKYELDKEYFSSLGIKLIPFSREKNDYSQLICILKSWDCIIRKSTLAHLGRNIDYSISFNEAPTKISIKFIIGKLNDKYDKSLIKSLMDSKYLFEWLVALKDDILFHIDISVKNINCKNNKYSILDGMKLLNKCIENTKNYVEFAKEIIDKIYDYLSINKLLKRKLNDDFIDNVFSLLLKNEYLFNNCHSLEFYNLYTKSRYFSLYNIFELLLNFNPELVDSKLIFELYKKIYDSDDIAEFIEFLASERMFKFIYLNPIDYFDSSLKKINAKSAFTAYAGLNSIYSCIDMSVHRFYDPIDIINAKIILNTSKLIENDYLARLVNKYLKSDRRHIKKLALALINVNFDRLKDIFVKNIELFFKDEDYYNDLALLIENHYGKFDEKIKSQLLEHINRASWVANENLLSLLKRHLLNIVSKYNKEITYVNEDKEEKELIDNFNKLISVKNVTNDVNNEFNGKTFDDAYKIYNKNKTGSKVKVDTYAKAFAKYLCVNNAKLLPHINQLDVNVLRNYYFYSKDDDFLFKLSNEIIKLNIKDVNTLYNPILRIVGNVLNVRTDECFDLYNKIDSNLLSGDDKFTRDDYLLKCLNHTLFLYIRVLLILAYNNKIDPEYLQNKINNLFSNYSNYIVKGCLSMNLDTILELGKKGFQQVYVDKLIDIILDNKFENINLSYIGLSTNNNIDSVSYYINRNDLYDFLKFTDYSNDIKNAQINLSFKIIIYYLLGNDFDINKAIDSLIASKNLGCLHYVFSDLATNFEKFNKDRIESLFKCLNVDEFLTLIKTYNIPSYLRNLNKIICANDYCQSIIDFYKGILKLSNGGSIIDFIDVITKYKDNKNYKDLIINIMDYSIRSYMKYKYLYSKLKGYMDLFKGNTLYKNEYKEWLSKLTKEDPKFKD